MAVQTTRTWSDRLDDMNLLDDHAAAAAWTRSPCSPVTHLHMQGTPPGAPPIHSALTVEKRP
jgi:hypothetical protein